MHQDRLRKGQNDNQAVEDLVVAHRLRNKVNVVVVEVEYGHSRLQQVEEDARDVAVARDLEEEVRKDDMGMEHAALGAPEEDDEGSSHTAAARQQGFLASSREDILEVDKDVLRVARRMAELLQFVVEL